MCLDGTFETLLSLRKVNGAKTWWLDWLSVCSCWQSSYLQRLLAGTYRSV